MPRYRVIDQRAHAWRPDDAWVVMDMETFCTAGTRSTRREARALRRSLEQRTDAPTTVYRIAHPRYRHGDTGHPCGPYSPGGSGAPYCSLSSVKGDDSPVPSYDGLGRMESHELCGFESIEALTAWFGPAFWELHEHGYAIHVYIVPGTDVRYGRKQCLFTYANATLSDVIPLTTLDPTIPDRIRREQQEREERRAWLEKRRRAEDENWRFSRSITRGDVTYSWAEPVEIAEAPKIPSTTWQSLGYTTESVDFTLSVDTSRFV